MKIIFHKITKKEFIKYESKIKIKSGASVGKMEIQDLNYKINNLAGQVRALDEESKSTYNR